MNARESWIAGVALVVAAVVPVQAARAQDYFGKNQVQYKTFQWRVIETQHFLVHYYPDERVAAMDAARMAERDYTRLSRIFNHQFRDKKPILVFASRADFGQNNVTGDLGEGTAGVTEPLRDRLLLPFSGDYRTFEHVLTHEMVHEFQFDIFAGGESGAIQALMRVNPPLWFSEGMAEYLSIGPNDPHTATVIRDAAINGHLPTVQQMTDHPNQYFAYRYGEAFWAYIGKRWGDAIVGAIMQDVPSMGVSRAFQTETGLSLRELGQQWREAMQKQFLPPIAHLEYPRSFAKPILNARRTGGQIFLAPALSPDGRYVAFLANGSFLRGQVFIDLWLANARTGKRITRLIKSTFNPNYEELQIVYSQSEFSPDGKELAFTALGQGQDNLYLLNVAKRKRIAKMRLPLDGITGPSWSPDGRQLVFSGDKGGITDLYTVGADGKNLRQLTNDKYGDLQPQWSPDGSMIAFATDRGPGADLVNLHLPPFRIAVYHVATGAIDVLPGQVGLNINPMWSPDSRSIAYVSNRTGIENVFLYDFASHQNYQLTHVIGGVTAITEYSPAISWSRKTDRLAFTYYANGKYTVWGIDNPRLLKGAPYRAPGPAQIAAAGSMADSTAIAAVTGTPLDTTVATAPGTGSFYVSSAGVRVSDSAPAGIDTSTISVAAILDSGSLTLPDTLDFRRYKYHVRYAPDFIAQPTVGYTRDNFGNGFYGGSAIQLSDMVGNNQLAFAGAINGRIEDSQAYASYTNLAHRLQYSLGIYRQPYYFGQGYSIVPTNTGNYIQTQVITRYAQNQIFGIGLYPFTRFSRAEFGLRLTSLNRADLVFTQLIDPTFTYATNYNEQQLNSHTVNYIQPYAAYVSDNVLWGNIAPIAGRRYRLQVEPAVGNFKWMEYLADYRRYDPILFDFLTVATRLTADISTGRDADSVIKYIGYPDLLPGYQDNQFLATEQNCALYNTVMYFRCSPLVGSRIALGSAELRFPLLGQGGLFGGALPLPPVEGAVFYDAGTAWFSGQHISFARKSVTNPGLQRGLLTSYGFSIRINVFNYAIVRWDYAIPLEAPLDANGHHHGIWQFSLYPPF